MPSSSPIASAAFADIGNSAIPLEAPDIATQAPVVDTTAITQVHTMSMVYNGTAASVVNLSMFEDETFSAPDVFTGTVRIDSATFVQGQLLLTNSVNTQNPTIDQTTIGQVHNMSGNNVDTQNPVCGLSTAAIHYPFVGINTDAGNVSIATAALTQLHILQTQDVNTNNPFTDSTSFQQRYNFASANVDMGNPDVGQARFPFMEITILPEVWTEINAPLQTKISKYVMLEKIGD